MVEAVFGRLPRNAAANANNNFNPSKTSTSSENRSVSDLNNGADDAVSERSSDTAVVSRVVTAEDSSPVLSDTASSNVLPTNTATESQPSTLRGGGSSVDSL